MNPERSHPISEKSTICLRFFREIEAVLQSTARPDLKLPVTLVSDELDRFKLWAGSIGAIYDPTHRDSSLDLRLVEAPRVASQVIAFLDICTKKLDPIYQIVSGRRVNRTSNVETYETPEEDDAPDSSLALEIQELSEARELFETAQIAISGLFRLSVAIRKATTRDRYMLADRKREAPFVDIYDIGHVGHKFPKLRNTDWLENRLGRAITRRREFIRYSREHTSKLARSAETHVTERTPVVKPKPDLPLTKNNAPSSSTTAPTVQVQSTLGSTTPSTFNNAKLDIFDELIQDETTESSSATTAVKEKDEEALEVPALPKEGEGGKEFLCPYCWTVQQFRGKERHCRRKWRKHVLQDLRPYVCTFPTCDLVMFPDSGTWFKHELDHHRLTWACNICNQSHFDSEGSFESHLLARHGHTIKSMPMSTLLNASRQPISTFDSSACPFCDPLFEDENLALDTSKFQLHLAKHMEQLALFALPRISHLEDESFVSIRAALSVADVNDGIEAEIVLSSQEPEDLPYHIAAYEGRGVEIKRLLQNGQDIDAIGQTWGTALGAAVEGKQPAVIKLLLESGANVHLPCGKYRDALEAAAAMKNPVLEKLLADAEDRTQRPNIYGDIKWKVESIATKFENLITLYSHTPRALHSQGEIDLECYIGFGYTILEWFRPIGSELDPELEIQAAGLKDVMPVISDFIRGLETLHELVSLILDSFKTDPVELDSLDRKALFKIFFFNDSILEVLHHVKIFREPLPEQERPLTDFLNMEGQNLVQAFQDIVKRATTSTVIPRKVTRLSEDCRQFQSVLTRSYEKFAEKLRDAMENREEGLKYFDTYPLEPNEYYSRKALLENKSYGTEHSESGDRKAPSEDLQTRGTTPAKKLQTEREAPASKVSNLQASGHKLSSESSPASAELQKAGPATVLQAPPDTRESDESSHTAMMASQAGEEITNSKGQSTTELSDVDLAKCIELNKSFQSRFLGILDQHLGIVDSIRIIMADFDAQIDQGQKESLKSACRKSEDALASCRSHIDIAFTEEMITQWKHEPSWDSSQQEFDLELKEMLRMFEAMRVTLQTLQESISEASAGNSADQSVPSWTAVLENFEWKAGYPFDQCWHDCAMDCIKSIGTNDQASPQLSEYDEGGSARLGRMLEHRKLFGSDAM